MKLKDALLQGNIEAVRNGLAYAALTASDDEIESVIKHAKKRHLYFDDDSNMMWIKNRIGRPDQIPPYAPPISLEVPLHVFLVYLEETDEMILRLKNDPEIIRQDIARSKIGSTHQAVAPIDATALKVAPVEPFKTEPSDTPASS